jgi:hypothetical protein
MIWSALFRNVVSQFDDNKAATSSCDVMTHLPKQWFQVIDRLIGALCVPFCVRPGSRRRSFQTSCNSSKNLRVNEKGRVKISRRAWLRDQAAEKVEAQPPVAAE